MTLTGQLPSGKGQIRKVFLRGKLVHYPQPRFVKWKADALKQLVSFGPRGYGEKPWECRCEMIVEYTPGDLKTRDVSGLLDALFHLLGAAGIVKDDGLIREVVWREHPLNRKAPMVRIELRPL